MTNEIRNFILNNHDLINQFMLSNQQINIIKFVIKSGEIDSKTLADHLGNSLQNSSTQLLKLYQNGWLQRIDVGDPTGGSLYIYKLVDGIL